MAKCTYYCLQVDYLSTPPSNLHYQIEHNELYISASLRLCGAAKMAHIETKKIAEIYRHLCLDVFSKRYNSEVGITVIEKKESGNNLTSTLLMIAKDTDKIKRVIKEKSK